MGELFLNLVNRSLSVGWMILAVWVVRYFLKRSPKGIRCILWGLVAFGLICPYTFESAFSLVLNPEPIPVKSIYSDDPTVRDNPYYHRIESKAAIVEDVLNPILTDTSGPALRGNILIFAGGWLVGVIVLSVYGGISFWKLKKKVAASVLVDDHIFLCDDISSPFILGVVKPRIYLPSGMCSEEIAEPGKTEGFFSGTDDRIPAGRGERCRCIIAHEKAHLERLDHWWKAFGYLLLTVYWFQPLVWLAYGMFCRDIELACDERAVRNMDKEKRAAYAQTLLDCSLSMGTAERCPLAFGEVGVRARVKAVLASEKPSFWISLASGLACGGVALCFLTVPKADLALRDPAARTWFNYYSWGFSGNDIDMGPGEVREIEIEDFPGVVFKWSYDRVEAVKEGKTEVLYFGMPVWSVAFTDLNGDGKQEICSTVSFGSGMIDDRVIVYDYVAGKSYELSDRGEYDYILRVAGGRTEALRRRYNSGDAMWEVGNVKLTRSGVSFLPTGEVTGSGASNEHSAFETP